ncbi:cytolysin [Mycena polygramma]|nr:cytolysin [Mycena polygramma]
MSTKTTWTDLSRLGWPINDIFRKLNAVRNGTMSGTGDMSINSGVAARWEWWSFNTTIGQPFIQGRRPTSTSREETAWSYDNTHNTKPFEDLWTESWTNTTSATVTAATSASITLSNHITIFNVASSGLDITISTESSSSETKETSYNLSHSWTLDVDPGEKLSLIRVITSVSEVADYGQTYGVTSDSMIGTEGKIWNGHYYWGLNINRYLDTPRGTLNIQGSSRITTYNFKLVRESSKGRTETPLPIDLTTDAVGAAQAPAAVLEAFQNIGKLAVSEDTVQVSVPGPAGQEPVAK